MKVIYENTDISNHPAQLYACALGFFDGIHTGHQNLISTLKQVSGLNKLNSMVFTFEKHPLSLLDAENTPKLITDNITKTSIFDELGIDKLYYCNVNMNFLSTEPEFFLENILVKKLNVRAIVAGFNFKFGCKGSGNSNVLLDFGKKNNINVTIVDPVYKDGILVSSTAVREYLNAGNIEMTNKLLGRMFSMHGRVIHGKKRGRDIGFPTANISVNNDLIVPQKGVYITKVNIENDVTERMGITNIGYNPTFGSNPISIETHIIDYNNDIYDKEIIIHFCKYIRGEIRFKNMSELSSQINNDRLEAFKYFNNMNVYK